MSDQFERKPHWLFRKNDGLPIFEIFYACLILLGMLTACIALPLVSWLRGLIGN